MNWNSQCAYCHTTGFEKNYDPATDSFASTWKAMGVSCEQCHGPLDGHAAKPKVPVRLSPQQDMENCAACHARREELTGKFHAGEKFDDHFRVVLPDLTDIYYPDGQVRDEDFEYGSFLTSKMGKAGISCLDCHNPHSGKLKLPAENNALCLSCHATPGQRGAVPIPDAAAHSHHKPDSTGNRCVECHMPQTTYMARDPRRDHGFTVPDPQLTKELGIPNSCNRCHADKTTDWAITWMQEWYQMQRPSRDRARLIARARSGDPAVSQPIMEFFKSEPNPAWRASLVLMLEGREQDPAVQEFLTAAASDPSPLVRDAAVRTLAQARPDVLQKALSDPSRGVRISAAWHLLMNRQTVPEGSRMEIGTWLSNISDGAGGAFQQARLAAIEKRLPDLERWTTLAVARDPSSGMFQQAAQLMYQADRLPQAKAFFDRSLAADPKNTDATYSLALLEAELGNSARSLELLRTTVSLASDFGRAWYNLGLAEAAYGDLPASAKALEKAESLLPRSPDPAFALATVQLRMNDPAKAAESARRALAIAPGHPGAMGLLRKFSP
jgi:predicted CXXCH cytochrome family protein